MHMKDKYPGEVTWSEDYDSFVCGPVDFSDALRWLKRGYDIFAKSWNGAGMYVTRLPELDVIPLTTKPSFWLKGVDNMLSSWVPSSSDLQSNSWYIILGKEMV